MKNKKRSIKTKEREDSGKKRRKNTSIYCSLHGENTGHTSREYKFIKASSGEKYKYNYVRRDYKKKFKELNLFQAEAAHQKSNYEKINKAFTKRKTSKKDTVNIADSSDSHSSSRRESNNYYPKAGKNKTSITYDSGSADNGKISSISISSKDRN